MNKIKWFAINFILILLLLFFTSSPSFAEAEELGGGRISLVQGQVHLQTGDEGEWAEPSVNFPIADGDRIVTEWDGKVELQFKDGTLVRVGEGSTLDLITLRFERTKSLIHLNLLEGKIYVNRISVTGETPSLYIELPYGVLSSHIPARFRIDLTPSEGKISVLQGSVEWKGEGRSIPLSQGKTLIVREEGHTVLGGLYERDEWDRWNEARDNEIFNRRYAQKYLPPEIEPWGYEIEPYGRWVYVQEYRYVWVPIVSVGWTPFRYGHWTWRKGVYCWIPREPWGWIPFHYGRWIYLPHHGWVWVPPVSRVIFWHPGAVAWHIGPTHISWVPLAPGETYYGYRSYGPSSVNLTKGNIHIPPSRFLNAKVKEAVVTMPKDSFFKKHPVTKVELKENPFLNPGKISGPPLEKPLPQEKPKVPLRVLKEVPERSKKELKTERPPVPKEGRKENLPLEPRLKGIEPRQPDKRVERPLLNEPIQNRVEKLDPIPSPSVGSGKRDSLPSPTIPSTRPKVQERVVVHPSPTPQPLLQKVQEMPNQKEAYRDLSARKEMPLSNPARVGNSTPTLPPVRERVELPSVHQERREQKNSVPLSGGEKLRLERPNFTSESRRFNESTPLSQKGVEPTFPSPRNEKVGAERLFQGGDRFSISLQHKGR